MPVVSEHVFIAVVAPKSPPPVITMVGLVHAARPAGGVPEVIVMLVCPVLVFPTFLKNMSYRDTHTQ